GPGSIAAIIAEFRMSAEFKQLSENSQKDYGRYLNRIAEKFGPYPIKGFTRRVALAWRDSMQTKPADCNYAMAVLRRLMSFALDRGHIDINPVLNPKQMKTGTYEPWPAEWIEKFQADAPAPMRRAMMLGLYTGQRKGDILKMSRKAIVDGWVNVVQQKTGAVLSIPLHRALLQELQEFSPRAITVLADINGMPYGRREFDRQFLNACRKIGVPGQFVFHGLRKNATINLLESGCSSAQVKAITGHRSDDMVNLYGRRVEQKHMAASAMAKWDSTK